MYMPLLICAVFFVLLFSWEGFWYLAGRSEEERALRRYQAVEHPASSGTDAYLDWLG